MYRSFSRTLALSGLALASLCAQAGAPEGVRTFEGRLDSGQSQRHPLPVQSGDLVYGSLEGREMRVTLLDADHAPVRQLVRGQGERQEFLFVAGDRPPYALEVMAPASGSYALRIDRVIGKTMQRQPDSLESPRLRTLRDDLTQGKGSDGFWETIQRQGTPLVERDGVTPPLKKGEALVTFLWRGARHGVRLFGSPSGDHEDLFRLGDSDVWYRSYRVPDSTRLGYLLAPDVPQLDASPMERRRAILATAQRDPFNTRHFPAQVQDRYDGESVLELPDAPPQRWIEPVKGQAQGILERHRFTSRHLGNTRDIVLYRPAGYRPGAAGNALLVLFDADEYLDKVPTPVILDNLIAAGRIPPTAAILIGNPTRTSRSAELPPNPAFVDFLAKELMPWAKQHGVRAPARRTVVAGSSYGGLAAAYAGLKAPEWFGKVYSQSGSFWWSPASRDTEPGWLTRRYAEAPRRPVVFHLEAGLFEAWRAGQISILESTRQLRDVLRAKGYTVSHAEYASGHDYLHWRGTLATGLTTLIGLPQRDAPLPRNMSSR
ncbi:alpha/beta hydrolase-fold protein [Paludibacterium paludis]|uniref:Enterochelin esterase n=1 Tax=Paludibacterium paludis TaxID=1225769 RepID=A0A918P0I2_9NEIS|nr:alpha/beta hydrolase-fold protein [Paludibacterium paludis]GGY09892.1 enterochelin esterase [Paludibacterium paludis]